MGHYGASHKRLTNRHAILDEDSSRPMNHVLDRVQLTQRQTAIFGSCPGHSKALAIFAAAVAAAFAAKGIT